jgi:hypothetical protein
MFKIKTEAKPLLSEEDLVELGWKKKISVNNQYLIEKGIIFYEKDNYYLTMSDSILNFIVKDPSIINIIPNPEDIRVKLKRPTREAFIIIEKLLIR